jgi:WhiB family redox-sensing transcriptional regulator
MIEPKFKRDPAETWWIERARCRDEDPELFFPIGNSEAAIAQAEHAIAICRQCPVRAECLEWSLNSCQDAGVWGGFGEEDRRQIRRLRRRRAASAVLTRNGSPEDELMPVG